jgi:hypothetical protein
MLIEPRPPGKMNYSEPAGMTWAKRTSTGTSVAAVIHHGVPQTERNGRQRHHRTIVYRISGLHTLAFADYSAGGREFSRAVGQQSGVY